MREESCLLYYNVDCFFFDFYGFYIIVKSILIIVYLIILLFVFMGYNIWVDKSFC